MVPSGQTWAFVADTVAKEGVGPAGKAYPAGKQREGARLGWVCSQRRSLEGEVRSLLLWTGMGDHMQSIPELWPDEDVGENE